MDTSLPQSQLLTFASTPQRPAHLSHRCFPSESHTRLISPRPLLLEDPNQHIWNDEFIPGTKLRIWDLDSLIHFL